MTDIGILSEKSLHAELKQWYGRTGDRFETSVDGFIIDIRRGDLLIEIQTRHFHLIKPKLETLLSSYPVRLVHPIPKEKWIVRQSNSGAFLGRRKSPKRGRAIDIFYELVRIPHLLAHPNLTVELLITRQDEIWRDDGRGSWRRRKWSLYDHRLLEVLDKVVFRSSLDYRDLLPEELPLTFTNRELADFLDCRLNLAQKMTYTLRKSGVLAAAGKRGRANLHALV